ncbi:MAG: type II secretion system protein [Candidatus Pacebacteria bacterium]|nr:type II secretion system protein [Candidatus Paceibacterota bacterium]
MQSSENQGLILVEVLLAVGILGLLLVPILNFFVTSLESSWLASKEVKAQSLIEEYLEAARSIRERNWEELAAGTYYLDLAGDRWELVASEEGETEDEFRRLLEISPVYRNETDLMVAEGEPGARFDPSTKKITASIFWHLLRERSFSVSAYLTRLDNLSWQQSTIADFEPGEFDLTKVTDPPRADGEIELEGGCFGGSPESLIYDDQLQNNWRVNCNGLRFLQWLLCQLIQFFNNGSVQEKATDYTWNDSPYALKITLEPPGSGSFWSWVRFYNYSSVCTKGFRNIHFYAYNPGDDEVVLNFTAVHNDWDNVELIVPAKEWTEIDIDYEQAQGDWDSLRSIYFSKWMSAGEPAVILYVDQIELTGGVGGYFTQGTYTSSVFDAGRPTAFNRITYQGDVSVQTEIGFQVSVADSDVGPWLFYGPGGTTDTNDLYTIPEGEGLWLGNNYGQYIRFKAYLRSFDGEETPVLNEIGINYSP